MTDRELVHIAKEARENAYAPYSSFKVGAAILCEDGAVYTGSNIENASYGATICAERTAAVTAVHAGNAKFRKIAIVGNGQDFCVPCGICRQFLSEFSRELIFLCANEEGAFRILTFEEMLPNAFSLRKL